MSDIRKYDCMNCKGHFEFDIALKEKQICVCKNCSNAHRVRPYKNGRVTIYNLCRKGTTCK